MEKWGRVTNRIAVGSGTGFPACACTATGPARVGCPGAKAELVAAGMLARLGEGAAADEEAIARERAAAADDRVADAGS